MLSSTHIAVDDVSHDMWYFASYSYLTKEYANMNIANLKFLVMIVSNNECLETFTKENLILNYNRRIYR